MAEQRETQREPQEIPHAVQHIEIAAKNPELLKSFLAEQFDWQFETTQVPSGDYHMFSTPGGAGGGGVVKTMEGQPVGVTPYINVKDIEGVQDACRRAGARISVPVTEVPDMGRFFWFEVEGAPPIACWESY